MQTEEEIEKEFWDKKAGDKIGTLKFCYIGLLFSTTIYLIAASIFMFTKIKMPLSLLVVAFMCISFIIGLVSLIVGLYSCLFIVKRSSNYEVKYHKVVFITAITIICVYFLMSIISMLIQVERYRHKKHATNIVFFHIYRVLIMATLVGLLVAYSIGLKKIMDILKGNNKIEEKDPNK